MSKRANVLRGTGTGIAIAAALLLTACESSEDVPGAVGGELQRAAGEPVDASSQMEADDSEEAFDSAWENFPQDAKEHLCGIIDSEWQDISDSWNADSTGIDGDDAILMVTAKCMDEGM